MAKTVSFRNFGSWTRWLFMSCVVLLLTACPTLEQDQDPASTDGDGTYKFRGETYAEFSIFWATDRRQTGDSNPKTMFAGDRGPGSLVYGTSTISVPNDHKIGEIERPRFWRFTIGDDPEKYMVVLPGETEILEEDPWFEKVRDRAVDGERTAFVFIHGYNTTFEEAALRTAQIGYDLKFPGAPILYSWPSKGESGLRAYATDEGNVRWTKGRLIEFLKDIHARSGADQITLIAHSMGGRLLGNALEILAQTTFDGGEMPFNEIILSAPDIDADVFISQIMPAMRKLAKGQTLYASSNDWALRFVADVLRDGKPRAGYSGDQIVVEKGLDTIDATEVRTDFWRHTDLSSRPVLTDIYELISYSKRAGERQYLQEQKTKDGVFWRLPP